MDDNREVSASHAFLAPIRGVRERMKCSQTPSILVQVSESVDTPHNRPRSPRVLPVVKYKSAKRHALFMYVFGPIMHRQVSEIKHAHQETPRNVCTSSRNVCGRRGGYNGIIRTK